MNEQVLLEKLNPAFDMASGGKAVIDYSACLTLQKQLFGEFGKAWDEGEEKAFEEGWAKLPKDDDGCVAKEVFMQTALKMAVTLNIIPALD